MATADADLDLVLAWHAALNAGDTERVMSLSTDNVEVGGPRGSGRGADRLHDWLGRAGIRLEPNRTFSGNERIVVEQTAHWPTGTGASSEPQLVASVFRVRDRKIDSVIRYADVSSALQAAGLDPSLAR